MTTDWNKKVLFIAHHFPPMGGPGINRSLQFAKYLSEQGYKLYVLTVTDKDIAEGAYPSDAKLLEKLPKDLEIIRIGIDAPNAFRNFFIRFRIYRLPWYLFYWRFWEPSAKWPRNCLKPALELIEKEGIEMMWSTSGPFVSAQLGGMIKRRTGIKWICDLRDPYTDTYSFTWPSKLHWHLARWMERRTYRLADKLVVVTPGMKRLYQKRNLVEAEKLVVITNGYGD